MAQISASLGEIAKRIFHSHPIETEVKCSADKFYCWFKNNMTDFTKTQPHIYKSVEVLEGDLLKTYKSFDATVTVTPKEGVEDECLVRWCLDCGKENEEVPIPDAHLEMLAVMSRELGPLIHKNITQIHSHPIETKVKCSANKFYSWLKNNTADLTKLEPHIYKSVKLLEGDGKSVGTVRLWKYVLPGVSPDVVLETKEMIKAMDDEKRLITFSVMEGSDLLKTYKSFDIRITVTPEEGVEGTECLVKWCIDCGKGNEEVPVPDAYLDMLAVMITELGPVIQLKA